jgi:hypothetical protein
LRRRADHDGVRLRDALQARGDVRRLAEGQRLAPTLAADLADHDGTRVNADPDRQPDPRVALEARVERRDRLDDAEGGAHGPPRVILAGERIPEVHEQTVAQVLRDVPVERADGVVARLLIRTHHLAQHLGIEPPGQLRGADQIAEHHRELPALRLRRPRRGRNRFSRLAGGLDPGGLGWQTCWRGCRRERSAAAIAEFAPRLDRCAAARTAQREGRAAFTAEPRLLAIVRLTPGTVHGHSTRVV